MLGVLWGSGLWLRFLWSVSHFGLHCLLTRAFINTVDVHNRMAEETWHHFFWTKRSLNSGGAWFAHAPLSRYNLLPAACPLLFFEHAFPLPSTLRPPSVLDGWIVLVAACHSACIAMVSLLCAFFKPPAAQGFPQGIWLIWISLQMQSSVRDNTMCLFAYICWSWLYAYDIL